MVGRSLWHPRSTMGAIVAEFTVVVALLAVMIFAAQRASNAETAGFSGAPDEAAHFVTALMIGDYLARDIPADPVEYAEQYYLHYPKVAFGIWPPLFHVLGGIWFMLVGANAPSAMTFVSLIAAFCAGALYLVGRRVLGRELALVAAVWFVLLPSFQALSSMFMMDLLGTALMLLATGAFGMYLRTGRATYANAFGFLAAGAIMTKYNGLALALLPPAAVLYSRQYHLLRRRAFWLPAVIVLAICGPWYALQAPLVWYASEPRAGWAEIPRWTLHNVTLLCGAVSWSLMPVVTLGGFVKSVRRDNARIDELWASLLALTTSVLVFHSVFYPSGEARYLLPAFAAIVLFLCAGIQKVCSVVLLHGATKPALRIAIIAVTAILVTSFERPAKPDRGFVQVAGSLLDAVPTDSTILISSDASGEGAFVAAIALADRRPNAVVLRASKLFASSTWMVQDYRLLYSTSSELEAVLDRARVSRIVIDEPRDGVFPHHRQLESVLAESTRWRLTSNSAHGSTRGFRIYARALPLPPGRPEFAIDMQHTLRKPLVFDAGPEPSTTRRSATSGE